MKKNTKKKYEWVKQPKVLILFLSQSRMFTFHARERERTKSPSVHVSCMTLSVCEGERERDEIEQDRTEQKSQTFRSSRTRRERNEKSRSLLSSLLSRQKFWNISSSDISSSNISRESFLSFSQGLISWDELSSFTFATDLSTWRLLSREVIVRTVVWVEIGIHFFINTKSKSDRVIIILILDLSVQTRVLVLPHSSLSSHLIWLVESILTQCSMSHRTRWGWHERKSCLSSYTQSHIPLYDYNNNKLTMMIKLRGFEMRWDENGWTREEG